MTSKILESMKKIFILLMAISVVFAMVSCKCTSNEQKTEEPVLAELVLENVVSADREYMFLHYDGKYNFYESCVEFEDFLDSDSLATVHGISNVFQVPVVDDGTSFDSKVVAIAHVADKSGEDVKEHALWVGDKPINDEEIKITLAQALEKLYASNYPKPHSRYVVLRKELGPNPDANAQYIFGNSQAQLYVDAVTGEVTNENPAYKGFGTKKK